MYFISNTLGNTVNSAFTDTDLSFCQDNVLVLYVWILFIFNFIELFTLGAMIILMGFIFNAFLYPYI